MLTAVFASQPSVGLTAPLPRYRSAAAAADAYTGQASPVLSPQAVAHNTPAPSPVGPKFTILVFFDLRNLRVFRETRRPRRHIAALSVRCQ